MFLIVCNTACIITLHASRSLLFIEFNRLCGSDLLPSFRGYWSGLEATASWQQTSNTLQISEEHLEFYSIPDYRLQNKVYAN